MVKNNWCSDLPDGEGAGIIDSERPSSDTGSRTKDNRSKMESSS